MKGEVDLDVWYANGTAHHTQRTATLEHKPCPPLTSACPPHSYLNTAWVGVYQLLWGIASVWTIFIPPFVAPHPPLGLKDVPTFLSNANKCFVGQNVDVFTGANTTSFSQTCIENPNNIYDQATEICHVDCHHLGAPITVFSIYILFNLTYNVVRRVLGVCVYGC